LSHLSNMNRGILILSLLFLQPKEYWKETFPLKNLTWLPISYFWHGKSAFICIKLFPSNRMVRWHSHSKQNRPPKDNIKTCLNRCLYSPKPICPLSIKKYIYWDKMIILEWKQEDSKILGITQQHFETTYNRV
jgi:hypothetical protein